MTLSIFVAAALCILMANFQASVVAQRGAPPAPNDDCADCINVNAVERSGVARFRFDTTGATTEATDPCISCCFFGVGQNANSIWFCKTVQADNTVVRVNTFGSDYDTVVAIWTTTSGDCPTGTFSNSTCTNDGGVTELNCNDEAADTLQSSTAAIANAGDKLFIEVAECTGTGAGFGGQASVTISETPR
jgi:hypothetical protein